MAARDNHTKTLSASVKHGSMQRGDHCSVFAATDLQFELAKLFLQDIQ